MSKAKILSKKFGYWTGVIVIGTVLGLVLQFAKAWTEPSATPPSVSVGAPINTGNNLQRKLGSLDVGGTISAGTGMPVTAGDIAGTRLCIGATCKTEWPDDSSFWDTYINYKGEKTNDIYNKNSGNVGIGTGNKIPEEKLDVEGSIRLKDYGFITWGGGQAKIMGANPENVLRFFTSNEERLSIGKTGNVGIGVTEPIVKLQIKGNIKLEDNGNGIIMRDSTTGTAWGLYFNKDNLVINNGNGEKIVGPLRCTTVTASGTEEATATCADGSTVVGGACGFTYDTYLANHPGSTQWFNNGLFWGDNQYKCEGKNIAADNIATNIVAVQAQARCCK